MEIDLGDIVVELHHIISPHSEDCVCIFIPQEKVLFIGDAVGVDYYNNCYLDKDKLRSLITAIKEFDFDICVMGHAEPVSKSDILNIMSSIGNQIYLHDNFHKHIDGFVEILMEGIKL
jgi:glyoxylase-like metal-dependent hydrolase (beta-lactamase superfamily II)